jgi:hypothetical protein
MFDYSDAPPPRENELIPAGTVVTLRMHIRPGNVGEDGMLKRSKDGTCEMLDIEYTVIDGPHAKRKLWENLVLEGTTPGQQDIAASNRGKLKQIIDSAYGLKPNDKSQEARVIRRKSLGEFEGITFLAKVGIEKGGLKDKNDPAGERWPDKNNVAAIITPDKREWHAVEQPPPFNGGSDGSAATAATSSMPATPSAPAMAAAPVQKPKWA